MHDVFISYSHCDAAFRTEVVEKLESAGIRCWYAPRDIQPGEEWADAIISGLKNCSVVILLFSEASNASNQVLREVGLAVDLKKTILPCRCDETMPSGSMQYYLSTLQWMDSSGDHEKALDELLELTRKSLSGGGSKGSSEVRAEVPGTSSGQGNASVSPSGKKENLVVSKKILPVLIAVILLINAGLVYYFYSRGSFTEKPAVSVRVDNSSDIYSDDELYDALQKGELVLASGEDFRSVDFGSFIRATIVNNKVYYFSPELNSPGARDFLYTVYDDHTVRLAEYGGEGMSEVIIPEMIDGLPVTEIGDSCFADNTEIEKVTFSDIIDYVGVEAFAGCTNLREINLSESLLDVDDSAFSESGLVNVSIPESSKEIGAGIFYGCENLESVYLPAGITLIRNDAFRETPKLNAVTIAAETVMIDMDAFDYGSNVTLIGIPGSYTETYASRMGLNFENYKQ